LNFEKFHLVPPGGKAMFAGAIFWRRIVDCLATDASVGGKAYPWHRELSSEPFLALRPEHTMRIIFDKVCADASFLPTIASEGMDIAMLRAPTVRNRVGPILMDSCARGALAMLSDAAITVATARNFQYCKVSPHSKVKQPRCQSAND
jgi:hypothetical protein